VLLVRQCGDGAMLAGGGSCAQKSSRCMLTNQLAQAPEMRWLVVVLGSCQRE
jgi:hypothetical protein